MKPMYFCFELLGGSVISRYSASTKGFSIVFLKYSADLAPTYSMISVFVLGSPQKLTILIISLCPNFITVPLAAMVSSFFFFSSCLGSALTVAAALRGINNPEKVAIFRERRFSATIKLCVFVAVAHSGTELIRNSHGTG